MLPSGSYRKTRGIIRRGTRALQPAATTVLTGTLYFVTDELIIERSNGTTWDSYSPSSPITPAQILKLVSLRA